MKKQKAIESVWLAKTLSVVLAILVLITMFLVHTSAAELKVDGSAATTISSTVDAEFTAIIPSYIEPAALGEASETYTVTLENALIPANNELTAKVEYSGAMHEQNGVALSYILQDEAKNQIQSGDRILSKAAGTPDDTVSFSFSAALTEKEKYAGIYIDTATFTFNVGEKIYTLDEINADNHLYAIGQTKSEYVIAEFNDDFSAVSVRKNGDTSDGIVTVYNDGNLWCDYSPMYLHRSTLKKATVESGVKNVSTGLFYKCAQLSDVNLSESITSIEQSAFNGCTALKTIRIPPKVKTIGDFAFRLCPLSQIELPNGITRIGAYAFQSTALTEVYIPESVTCIGENPSAIGDWWPSDDAFSYCKKLKSITVSETNNNYCDIDGVLFNKDKSCLIDFPCASPQTEYVVPESVKAIDIGAFQNCANLKKLTLSNNIDTISEGMFSNCTSLQSFVIPDSVVSIKQQAFTNCYSLQSITIGVNVEEIENLGGLTTVRNLAEIVVSENNHVFCSADGVLFNKDKTNLILYPKKKPETTYQIPNSVTCIGPNAFYECAGLQEVVIPDSVENIGAYAFAKCTSLQELVIPDNVKTIEQSVFEKCTALNNVALGSGVTDIKDWAFSGCTALENIFIPKNVTNISKYTFTSRYLKTICGVSGSYAETFATENGYTFVAV